MDYVPINESLFEGAVSFECEPAVANPNDPQDYGKYIKPWRLPFSELHLFPDSLIARAEKPSGVRLRFKTNSTRIGMNVIPDENIRLFDLMVKGKFLQTARLDKLKESILFEGLTTDDKIVEIWLPQFYPVCIRNILIDSNAYLKIVEDFRPRWITYGSSITHNMRAHSPSQTWPALVARKHDLHLTSLGYAGQCHLDPLVARVIRDLPAEFITLKVGVNILITQSLSPRMLEANLIGFIKTIREGHPKTPLIVISPIICPLWEKQKNIFDLNIGDVRKIIKTKIELLRNAGDKELTYCSGLKLFGEDIAEEYMPDNIHPNGDGYKIMG